MEVELRPASQSFLSKVFYGRQFIEARLCIAPLMLSKIHMRPFLMDKLQFYVHELTGIVISKE